MSKIELDDMILEHPKFIRAVKLAGSDAVFLWLGLRAYCARMLTDGFVPADMVEEVRGPRDSAARASALSALKEAKLVDDSDGGVVLHDYLDWAPSRSQILEWRKANAERKARSRANAERKTGSGTNVTRESRCDNANVTVGVTRESHRSHGGSHAGVLEPSPSPSPSPFTLPIGRDPPITPPSEAWREYGQSESRSGAEPEPATVEPFRLTAGEPLDPTQPPEDQPEPKTLQRGIQAAKRAKEPKRQKPTETDPPDMLEPTEATLAAATESRRDWRADWAQCRDWALSKGVRRLDWQATLRGWMRRNAEQSRSGFGRRPAPMPPQPNDESNRYDPRKSPNVRIIE